MLKHKDGQLSAESVATDFHTSCGLHISSRTVRRELNVMSLHGQAAAYINAQRQIQWCESTGAVFSGVALCQVWFFFQELGLGP